MFQGYIRQVQGSNGSNCAQLVRPWGSTQTFPVEHNEVKHLRSIGQAVIQAWGAAHVPRVVPREGRIRLLSEKGPQPSVGIEELMLQLEVLPEEIVLHYMKHWSYNSMHCTTKAEHINMGQHGIARSFRTHQVSPTKRQSEELNCSFNKCSDEGQACTRETRQLTGFFHGTEQLGVVALRGLNTIAAYWKLPKGLRWVPESQQPTSRRQGSVKSYNPRCTTRQLVHKGE